MYNVFTNVMDYFNGDIQNQDKELASKVVALYKCNEKLLLGGKRFTGINSKENTMTSDVLHCTKGQCGY